MIDPEWLKVVSADLLLEAGVRLLLHSWVVAPILDGRKLRGVLFESKEGRRAILAKVVVDATGDLDVCAGAGAPYESDFEAEGSNVQHCVNTAWMWAGVDFGRWLAFKQGEPQAYQALLAGGPRGARLPRDAARRLARRRRPVPRPASGRLQRPRDRRPDDAWSSSRAAA